MAIKKRITILMVALLSIIIVSCSKDSDSSSIGESSIVGTWKYTWYDGYESGYELITFKSNGSGTYEEWFYERGQYFLEENIEEFKYKYNASKKELSLTYVEENGEIGPYRFYCEISGSRMILRAKKEDNEEWEGVYVRQ